GPSSAMRCPSRVRCAAACRNRSFGTLIPQKCWARTVNPRGQTMPLGRRDEVASGLAAKRKWAMRVRQRLVHLERKHPPPPPPSPEDLALVQRWKQITQRLMKMLEQALPQMDEGQQAQVMQGMEKFFHEHDGPYKSWLQHLLDGSCRLPE